MRNLNFKKCTLNTISVWDLNNTTEKDGKDGGVHDDDKDVYNVIFLSDDARTLLFSSNLRRIAARLEWSVSALTLTVSILYTLSLYRYTFNRIKIL